MDEIKKIVAEGMHPWQNIIIENNIIKAKVPTYFEILSASDKLITHLRENGYEIKKIDEV